MARKDTKRLVRAAEEAGWDVRKGGKHLKLYPADGSRPIPVPGNPTKQGLRNFIAQLRRADLEV